MMGKKNTSPVNDPRSPRSPRRLRTAERQGRALELRLAGWTYAQIGAELGISQPAAFKLVNRALQQIRAKAAETSEEVLALELQRLDRWLQVADRAVHDGDVNAVAHCLRIQERRAKLLGLDVAPPPTDVRIVLRWDDGDHDDSASNASPNAA